MRTTIEIPDDLRARLLQLSAERGEKGLSRLVQDAIRLYLQTSEDRRHRGAAARAVLGSFTDKEARELRDSVQRQRARWR